MLNIIIPMAGAGSRFMEAGYSEPKPLIPIHGIPMIKVVIDNLMPAQSHRFIYICQREHVETYGLRAKLSAWASNSELIEIDGLTEGAACTVLAAKSFINNDSPLMIANSDQFIDMDINQYLHVLNDVTLDGLIMTMRANDPKWSFVGLDSDGNVTQVVEKEVISDEATVGIYNFRHGRSFVNAAEAMIANNERVNGEFYVAPTYNRLIASGHKIGIYNIGSVGAGMYGLGIPADLESFLVHPLAQSIHLNKS
ncbi:MAG: glycosyltransferase family 2 protein [Methylococcaceae bacterium]